MATLELDGLTKRYGKKTAIEDIRLSMGDGEFFVILGPSGAGKTTTLKSVAGLVEVDAGDVTIAGRRMTGVEPYHRNVAMAFESYALYPQGTVFDNLASPLRSGRTGKYSAQDQKQRIDLVTTTLGINDLLSRFPRELSNGQRQRVALGRVLVRPADVYLLDEPLSHLDAKLRATMRAELKHLGAMSSTTTLYVTHDYQEALALGHRIAILRHGKVVQVGTPEEVWMRPVDSFVAKALGQPEINMLEGVVEDGRIVAAEGGVVVPVPAGSSLSRGQKVRVGIRARDIQIAPPPGGEDQLRMKGTVSMSERLGRAIELDCHIGDAVVIAVDSSDHAPLQGDPVELGVALYLVQVFAGGEPDEDTVRIGAAAPTPEALRDSGRALSDPSGRQA
jgi:multiple sugar transport system ATP-binding protein